jgi:hypothetical protein
MLKVVTDGAEAQADELALSLDDLAREGARRMLVTALEAEVAAYLERHRDERDENGQRWWFGTGRRGQGRSPSGRARSGSPRHESTIGG